MRRHTTRLWATLLTLVLTVGLMACDGQQVEDDPRAALRDAVMAFRDYEGIELTIGAELDEAAQASARDEGEFSEEELALLTDSTLTVRAVEGEDDTQGQSEFVVVVGDETVLTVRALADYELYALIDLPAIERVAESLDAGEGFQQSITEFEQAAGMFGLGQVASAAREADWIRVAGLQEMIEMSEEGQAGDEDDELDEADLEELTREVGERLLDFLEDEEVEVEHVGSEDVGERVRITATGAQLRELAVDVLEPFDEVAGDAADAAGTGMDTDELRSELEESIPDDLRLSLDAWIDDGQLSQVAVDVFELARAAEAEDVPDGEFLIAIAIAEFSGPVEAPEAEVTFDVFEIFGNMLGGLGELGGEGAEQQPGELPDEGELELGEDFCLSEEEVAGFLEQLPEEQRDLDDDEIESMLGLPVC